METVKRAGETPVRRLTAVESSPQRDAANETKSNRKAKTKRNGAASTHLKMDITLPGVRISLQTSDKWMIFAILTAAFFGIVWKLY